MTGNTRPRRRGIWISFAALAAIALTAALATGAWAILRHPHTGLTGTMVYQRPATTLVIEAPGARVTLRPGPPGRVRVQRRVTWSPGGKPAIREAWAGRVLRISATPCATAAAVMSCSIRLDIEVPPGVAVRVDTTSGHISVLDLTGPADLRVTSGSISMVGVGGRVRASATSGAITGIGLASRWVSAAITSGAVRLAFAYPPRQVSAVATSGNVMITVPRGARYRVAASAGPGILGISPALTDRHSGRLIRLAVTSGHASVAYR